MSRILARVLGGSAGPDPVLPRLPTRFEPGLEMATGPALTADEPQAVGPADLEPFAPAGDRVVRAASPAARLNDPLAGRGSWPAPPPAGPPPAVPASGPGGPGSPGGRPGPGHQPGGASPSGPAAGTAGRAGLAEPSRPEEAGSPRPGHQRPAYLVRSASDVPELAEPPASQPHPPGRTAGPAGPDRPADPAPMAAARGELTGQPRWPEPSPVPGGRPGRAAPRRAARPVQGPAEAEPVVHITIGQVEIRADRAAAGGQAPAARPAARARRVAPELSEYLQRRGKQR
jgi:hypothetical protein